jgi:hypothetical protein
MDLRELIKRPQEILAQTTINIRRRNSALASTFINVLYSKIFSWIKTISCLLKLILKLTGIIILRVNLGQRFVFKNLFMDKNDFLFNQINTEN